MDETDIRCTLCGKPIDTFKAVIENGDESFTLCSTACLEAWTQQQKTEEQAHEFLDLGAFVDAEADKLDGEEEGLEETSDDAGDNADEQEPFYQELKETETLGEYGGQDGTSDEYQIKDKVEKIPEQPQDPFDIVENLITEEHEPGVVKQLDPKPEEQEGRELVDETGRKEQEDTKRMLQELYEQQSRKKKEQEMDEDRDKA